MARSNKKFSPTVDGRIEVPLAARVSEERKNQMQSSFTEHQQMLKDSMEGDAPTKTTTNDGYEVEFRGVDLNRSFENMGQNIDKTSIDRIIDTVNKDIPKQ